MTSSDSEERAFALLQWVPYSLPSEFSEELAASGHYSRLQRERSDKALDEFDSVNQRKPSSELEAFKELERLGVYSQADFFSPTKASAGFYVKRLREQLRREPQEGGSKPPSPNEGSRSSIGRRRRRHR